MPSKTVSTEQIPTLLDRLGRLALPGFIVLLGLATGRIISTYDVFNHTIDEPAHIAAGMEWLDKGVYKYEPQHPPLARVMTAVGPYLAGARTVGRDGIYYEGAAILYNQGTYDRTLRLARLGILPFFWLGAAAVFWWSRRSFGGGTALIIAAIFTAMPAILGHGGLATTDMALTGCLLAAVFTAAAWAEEPTILRGALFGLFGGLAILSKFSFLPFFGLTALIAIAWWWFSTKPAGLGGIVAKRAASLGVAAVVVILLTALMYRFSLAPLREGIQQVSAHNKAGHISYLLGETSEVGFWYYYPVALFFKTPLGLLILALAGVWFFGKDQRLRIVSSLGLALLLVGMWSDINIGTRHLLPIFGAMAVFAGLAAAKALESRTAWVKWGAVGLLAWGLLGPAIDHPDYLSYFNELAGSQPEKILVDSDLDWGQDMKRLAAKLKEVGAQQVTFSPFIIAYLEKVHGFPPIQPSDPVYPSAGWNAVSTSVWKLSRLGLDPKEKVKTWPDSVPAQQRVGKGVLLYYFSPAR